MQINTRPLTARTTRITIEHYSMPEMQERKIRKEKARPLNEPKKFSLRKMSSK